MTGSEKPLVLPDPIELRDLLARYLHGNTGEVERLRDELHTLFCAYAAASAPVERALATINREVELLARSTCGWHDRTMQPLKNVVMMCFLDCYYPQS